MNFGMKKDLSNCYKKVVIKYDDKTSSTYSLNTYNEHPFLKNFIPKNQFNEILDKANIIIYDGKLKKAKFDKVEINTIAYILIFISFIFTLIYILLMYYAPRKESNQNALKIFGIIFFCLSIAILFGVSIFFSLQPLKGDKALYQFYKKEMYNYIDQLNKKWENVMIFKYEKSTKNIICLVKVNKDSFDTNESTARKFNSSIRIIK